MAAKKISELAASSGLVAADLVPVVDDPSGTAVTQKATMTQVQTMVLAGVAGTTTLPGHLVVDDNVSIGNTILAQAALNISPVAGVITGVNQWGLLSQAYLQGTTKSVGVGSGVYVDTATAVAGVALDVTDGATANGGVITTQYGLRIANLAAGGTNYSIHTGTAPSVLGGDVTVGGTLEVTGVATITAQPILSSLTASLPVFTDGSKGLVSNAMTGTGSVVMSASPTLSGTVNVAAITASGTATLNGNVVLGDNSSDTITVTGRLVSNVVPSTSGTRDLGADALRFNNAYLDVVHSNRMATGGQAPDAFTQLLFASSSTTLSCMRLPHGSAPTSPTDGDIWTTPTGLYVRINGSTVGPLS